MRDCLLLRYGEIGIKSKRTRAIFERRYVLALREALSRIGIEKCVIENHGGRFVLYCDDVVSASEQVRHVAGVMSLSQGVCFRFTTLDELCKELSSLCKDKVKDKSFALKVKRVGKHEWRSRELISKVAEIIGPDAAGVDLRNPQVALHIEVRENKCFVYTDSIKGIGGLPPKSGGKVLLLFSGGIDSPVAYHELIKRGSMVDFLYIDLLGDGVIDDVARVYNYLIKKYAYGYTPKLFVVNGLELVKKLHKEVPSRIRQVQLKILFYNIAAHLAKKNGYQAIGTGEALAQKSTQTLESLSFISSHISELVLRPLLTSDKSAVMQQAQEIGTLAHSEKVREYCNLSTGPVSTAPKAKDFVDVPSFDEEIARVFESMTICKGIYEIDEQEKKQSVVGDVQLIDIRPLSLQKMQPLEGAHSHPYPYVLEELELFNDGKTYLFVCEFGVQSMQVARFVEKQKGKAAGVSVKDYLRYFAKK